MLASEIPGAKLLILPGVSHFAMLQNPALFNRRGARRSWPTEWL